MYQNTKDLIRTIHNKNKVDYNTKTGRATLNLLADAFLEINMYFLELIQNALDSGSSSIAIKDCDHYLEFSHNAQSFGFVARIQF